jgi:perosamine synthetase
MNRPVLFAIGLQTPSERDQMARHLWEHGIDSAKYLEDIVDVARFSFSYREDCLCAEIGSKTTLVMPHCYSLSSKDLDLILKSVKQFFAHNK